MPDTNGSYTESMRNVFKAAQVPGHMKGVEAQGMPVAFEDVSVAGLVHGIKIPGMAGNVMLGRSPCVQEGEQLTHLAMSEGVPKSFDEVKKSIDWKPGVICFRESLATMHRRLEKMAAPVVERTELPRGETTRIPCFKGYGEEV